MTDLMPEGFRSHPHNIEAEQAYIGSILVRNEGFEITKSALTSDMFYEPVHRKIFAAIQRMIDAGGIADHITIRREFDEDEALKDVERGRYLESLAVAAECILNVSDYAKVIRDLACKRAIIIAAQEAMDKAFDPSFTGAASEISNDLSLIMENIRAGSMTHLIRSASDEVDDLIIHLAKEQISVTTGFKPIDDSMGGGMRGGCLYAIEAPGKTFKTGFIAGVFEKSSLDIGTPTLVISLEMSTRDILQRIMAGNAQRSFFGIEKESIRSKVKSKIQDFQRLARMREKLSFVAHLPSSSIDQILSVMSDAVVEKGVKLFLIDYYQLIGGKRRDQSSADHLEEVAYRLMGFASKHEVIVMIASQTNNDGGTLRSGGLRRACSWLGSLNKVEVNTGAIDMDETGLWVEVQMNRYGPSHDIGSKFSPAFRIAPGPVLREWNDA